MPLICYSNKIRHVMSIKLRSSFIKVSVFMPLIAMIRMIEALTQWNTVEL